MDELLQTRHAPEAASAFIPRCAGSVFFVPGTPAEVNGLMRGPWMRDFIQAYPPFTEDSTRTDKGGGVGWSRGQSFFSTCNYMIYSKRSSKMILTVAP